MLYTKSPMSHHQLFVMYSGLRSHSVLNPYPKPYEVSSRHQALSLLLLFSSFYSLHALIKLAVSLFDLHHIMSRKGVTFPCGSSSSWALCSETFYWQSANQLRQFQIRDLEMLIHQGWLWSPALAMSIILHEIQ